MATAVVACSSTVVVSCAHAAAASGGHLVDKMAAAGRHHTARSRRWTAAAPGGLFAFKLAIITGAWRRTEAEPEDEGRAGPAAATCLTHGCVLNMKMQEKTSQINFFGSILIKDGVQRFIGGKVSYKRGKN